jgi:non-specific serine/threonine protein kinase
LFYPFYLCEFAAALQSMGRFNEALNEVGNALLFSEEKGYRWMVPEILRRKAEVLRAQGLSETSLIEGLFQQAMAEASKQGALYWELSAGVSLGAFREASVPTVLLPIYRRFTEGFSSPRLLEAKALIEASTA